MGGTFNPIHYGHLVLAENSYEQLGLDKILFMPSKNPPHKAKPEDVTEQQRVDMIALAIQNNEHFELSMLELEREGVTYTADTLTQLTAHHMDTEYYFIVGADSLFNLQNWMKPQTIFNLCTIVAANRDNVDKSQLLQQVEFLKNAYSASIVLIDMPTIQIASKVIRERIAAQKSVRYYLPDTVIEYINKNELYTTDPEVM
jgi:nicotinate-nucleotide adenylyltransferase